MATVTSVTEQQTMKSHLNRHSGPSDVTHPKKWAPAPYELRKKWSEEEPLPFLKRLDHFVERSPQKPALLWIEDGKTTKSFTYEEFDRKTRAIAAAMVDSWKVAGGDRVVLLYEPGLEFLAAFVACFHAGAIAVPMYPPNPNDLKRDLPKMTKLVTDSGAKLVLTSNSYYNVVRLSFFRAICWPGEVWKCTDGIKPLSKPMERNLGSSPSPVAFLQYTSGSTADPKGVMVGHENIAHHLNFVIRTLRLTEESRFFSWLPQYHDLGLIVAYLSVLASGGTGFYMSPIAFIKHPSLWVQLMSEHKITHTAAPNFALELCVRKFNKSRDGKNLDLSSLENILNAAEPVREDSIRKWNNTFTPFNWNPIAMCPCYGLAEHVVGIVGWGKKVIEVGEGVQRHKVHSSGHLWTYATDGRVAIVNPDTKTLCSEGEEGEIWARSRSVTLGYWGKPELTEEVFHAKMTPGTPGSDDEEYLRTGDLGIVVENELFVTGRIKDLIIIRGKNYYPQDIEKTVEDASEHVRAGCCAVFSMQTSSESSPSHPSSEESVAVVAEVRSSGLPKAELTAVTNAIRKAVVSNHAIVVTTVAIIPPRTIPKTTSGKIRRRVTCANLTQGALKILNSDICSPHFSTLEEERQIAAALQKEAKENKTKEIEEKTKTESEKETTKTVNVENTKTKSGEEKTETESEKEKTKTESEKEKTKTESEKEKTLSNEENDKALPKTVMEKDLKGKEREQGNPKSKIEKKEDSEKCKKENQNPEGEGEGEGGEGEGGGGEIDGLAKWRNMPMVEAIIDILGLQGQEIKPEEDLISIGLTSLTGIDVIELLEERTGMALEPEQLQMLTMKDFQDIDNGVDLSSILKVKEEIEKEKLLAMKATMEASMTKMENGSIPTKITVA